MAMLTNDCNISFIDLHLLYMLQFLWRLFQQIELHEFEEITVLVATLAWNNSSTSTFEEGVKAYEFTLYQVS